MAGFLISGFGFFFKGGVYMTPGQLALLSEFTPVPSHGSTFVYMIPKCHAGMSHPGVSSPQLLYWGEHFNPV